MRPCARCGDAGPPTRPGRSGTPDPAHAPLADLEARLNRTPTDQELAAHMRIDVSRLWDILGQVSLTSSIALDGLFVEGMTLAQIGDILRVTSRGCPCCIPERCWPCGQSCWPPCADGCIGTTQRDAV